MSDAAIAARDAEMARDELKYGEAAQRQAEVEEIAAAFDAAHGLQRIADLLGNPADPEAEVVRLLEAHRRLSYALGGLLVAQASPFPAMKQQQTGIAEDMLIRYGHPDAQVTL